MLSFLTLLFPEVWLRMRSFPVALHRPWVRLDSAALVRWSSETRQVLFLVMGPRAARAGQPLGRLSPQWACGLTFICRLCSRLDPFRGSEWNRNLSVFQQLR